MSRIVITGAEVISPIGNNLEQFFMGLKQGIKGISNLKGIDTEKFPTMLGAEIKVNGFVTKYNTSVDRKSAFMKDVLNQLHKKYKWLNEISADQKKLQLGAGLDYFDLINYSNGKDMGFENSQNATTSTYQVTRELAEKYSIDGGFSVNVTACVASSQAVGHSYRTLKNSDKIKLILAGGFESMLNHPHYMGFYKLGALSTWKGDPTESCRPFDKDRCGLVLGEGAAVMVLQKEEDADKSKILVEIAGYSSTNDSYMVTDPDPQGKYLAKAAIQAIMEAGLKLDDIDCVHLHGTGTRKNAIAESNALSLVFPDRFKELPVFSLKGQIGHLIAACGAVEILGAIYSIQNQVVLPTVNFNTPDTEAPLNVIKENPCYMKINNVLKLNSAFGGQNTAIILRKYDR